MTVSVHWIFNATMLHLVLFRVNFATVFKEKKP